MLVNLSVLVVVPAENGMMMNVAYCWCPWLLFLTFIWIFVLCACLVQYIYSQKCALTNSHPLQNLVSNMSWRMPFNVGMQKKNMNWWEFSLLILLLKPYVSCLMEVQCNLLYFLPSIRYVHFKFLENSAWKFLIGKKFH